MFDHTYPIAHINYFSNQSDADSCLYSIAACESMTSIDMFAKNKASLLYSTPLSLIGKLSSSDSSRRWNNRISLMAAASNIVAVRKLGQNWNFPLLTNEGKLSTDTFSINFSFAFPSGFIKLQPFFHQFWAFRLFSPRKINNFNDSSFRAA